MIEKKISAKKYIQSFLLYVLIFLFASLLFFAASLIGSNGPQDDASSAEDIVIDESIHSTVSKSGFSYELFIPKDYSADMGYPLFVCLSPSGKGTQFYKEVYPSASESGWIMACSNDFRNNIGPEEYMPKLEGMIADVKRNHKIGDIYIGGLSGGGMGSYVVSYFKPIFRGLLVNSGAIHANMNSVGEAKKMHLKKIAMICGKKDNVVPCERMKKDEALLKSAGYETLLIEFDGGHEIAPHGSYKTAIEWLGAD